MGNKKILIICISTHHGNTIKIAKVISDILSAKVVKPTDVDIKNVFDYDLIGFGSGIYFGNYHKSLLDVINKSPILKDKKVFIFSTSGMKQGGLFNNFNKALKDKLLKKGFDVIGEFNCLGFDTAGPLKAIGGLNKNRPNEKDLKKAQDFAREINNKIN